MATLCRAHRLLFIHGRRTGSTAVRQALDEHLGGENVPRGEVRDEQGRTLLARHSTLPELLRHGAITPEQRQELFVFTAVRNPFDDLVTLYFKKKQLWERIEAGLEAPDPNPGRMANLRLWATRPFPEVIASHYGPSFPQRLLGRGQTRRFEHTEGANHVMRFEHLQEDLDEVLRRAAVTVPVPLPRVNSTPSREPDYRKYYTPAARRIVERAFRAEIERYGYSF